MSESSNLLSPALASTQLSLITLPSRAACPVDLLDAVAAFNAGERPAAVATTRWLGECALDEHGSARTYLWVADGRVHGFFAVSVGLGRIEREALATLEAGPRPLPAVLLAQAARSSDTKRLAPGAILTSALGIAERISQYTGVGALMLDPFDQPTSDMWRRRGFQPVLDSPPRGRERRLWRTLGA